MKTKHLFAIAIFAIFTGLTSCLEVPETDSDSYGNWTWTYDFETKVLTFQGTGVIWRYSGYDCYFNDVQKVIIGEGITGIDTEAFLGASLKFISIPNSVTSIGYDAFAGCSDLTSIAIPNSVTSIGDYAFSRSGLTSVSIPSSITSIGKGTFSDCTRLMSVEIPNSVTSIGESAFYNCMSLASIIIPNRVTSIEDETFFGCSSLTSIEIPNSVTNIGERAFTGCSSMPVIDNGRYADTYLIEVTDDKISGFTFKNGTKWIGTDAFKDCRYLTSIIIPNSIISIGNSAFSGCNQLQEIILSENLTEIDKFTFASCSSLKKIVLPQDMKTIKGGAFDKCDHLTSLTCLATIPPKTTTTWVNSVSYRPFDDESKIDLYVPAGSVEYYKDDDYWKKFKSISAIQ